MRASSSGSWSPSSDDPLRLLDELHGIADHREGLQAEEVHLEQPELFDGTHGEPGDQLGPLGVLVQRHALHERLVRDHDRGGVNGGVARAALQRLGHGPQLGHARIALDLLRERRGFLERLVERDVEREARDELRDAVGLAVGEAEDARHVAEHRLGPHGPERDDVGDAVGAVAVDDVADHLVAAVVGEVDVHVGHRDPLGVQKPLEEQPVPDRVDIGDAEAIRGEGAGRRPPARPDRDPLPPRVRDEVPHDEEIPGESHLLDDAELEAEALDHRVGGGRAVARGQALVGQVLQVRIEREPVGHLVARQMELPERELDIAPLRHGQGVRVRLGQLLEHRAHLVGRLQVELFGREAPAVRVGHRRAGLDAQERLVGPGVLGLEVVRVIGPDEGRADRAGDPDGALRDLALLLESVGLDLHEVVVLAEDLLIPARRLERLGLVARGELTAHLGIEAAGEHEQPLGVLGEELPVHPRLVVVALEIGLGDESHEIGVADLVADEDRAVAGALVAAVLPRSLGAASRRDVQLRAEDGLHAGLHAGRVEIDAAEEVAVVGERERGEAQLLRRAGRASRGARRRRAGCTPSGRAGERNRRAVSDFFTPIRWCSAAWRRCRRPRGSPRAPR